MAQILSSGLLGDKYLALVPGNLDQTIPPDGQITSTIAPMSLEDIIGQVLFSSGGGKKSDGEGEKLK